MTVPPDAVAREPRHRLWIATAALALALLMGYRLLAIHLAHLDLYVDEAQYWTWAQHLAWGYYSKPPVIAWVIAASQRVCGEGITCVKGSSPVLYALTSLVVLALGMRLFSLRVGLWSAATFALLPGVSLSALIVSTDVPLALAWAVGLYAYARALEDNRWHWWLALGAALGIGLLTKYTMGLFALSAVLHLGSDARLRHHLRNPRAWMAALIGALLLAPNLAWNAAHDWPTVRHTADISNLRGGATLHPSQLAGFLGSQLAVMGPLFAAYAWIAVVRARRCWAEPRLRLLLCFSLPFLAAISLQALLGRANGNWAAMTYVAGTLLVCAVALEAKRRAWLAAAVLFAAALMPLAYHLDAIVAAVGVPLGAHRDPFKRVRGWAAFGAAVGGRLAERPGALLLGDDREVLAESMYYARPHPLDAVRWNPAHTIDDHYALTTTMDDKLGRDFLYVTSASALAPGMAGAFASAQPQAAIRIAVEPGLDRVYAVWLLRGFRGYAR